MKSFTTVLLIGLMVLTLGVTSGAFAQGGPPANRPNNQGQNVSAISTQTKVNVTGTLKSVGTGGYTVELQDGKTTEVGFGPYWYLDKIGLKLKVGDSVTMTGVYYNNHFVPITVTVSAKTFTLRDAAGRPVWAGNRGSSQTAGWHKHGKGKRMNNQNNTNMGNGKRYGMNNK